MRKRRLISLGIAACLVVVGFALLTLLAKCPVTRENGEKIETGMTKQQVEALLGGPAGDYSGGWYVAEWPDGLNGGWLPREEWVGNRVAIAVWFADNQVFATKFGKVRPSGQGFWGWLHRLLRR